MSFVERIGRINRIKRKLDNGFIRNLGWLGGSALIVRVFRLITTVILARCLTSYDYGLVAIVMMTYEFTSIFTYVGISAKLIQADREDLETLCNSAYWLSCVIFLTLFILQCIVAFPIAWFYHESKLILPICTLASVYLMVPIGVIQGILIRRENRLKVIAISNGLQLLVGNFLTAIFALLGMGMWAVVLPKLLAYPIEAVIYYTNHPWRLTRGFTTERWGEIFSFGKNLLGMALLSTLRNNLDYLIVGRFLGIKELGIYFFAFNAGLGISLTIIHSIFTALFPHLCAVQSNFFQFKKQYFSSIKIIGFIIIPFVILQSSLAYLYVTIVFGQKWIVAIPVLILICLSAIPRPFGAAASTLLIAVGKPHLSLRWDLLFTLIFAVGLVIGVHWQAIGVATAVLLTHMILLPLFTVWATRYVFASIKV